MNELPSRLLRDVLWSCSDERYASEQAFGEAVHQYQVDIRDNADHWAPAARVLEQPRVRVSFRCWDGEEQVEPVLELEARDGAGFSALELMYGICDGIAAHLSARSRKLYDHRFFEGLGLGSSEGVPLYAVYFGS